MLDPNQVAPQWHLDSTEDRESMEPPPLVLIIESPNLDDLNCGRSEGTALSSALTLAGIENKLFQPTEIGSFNRCLDILLDIIAPYGSAMATPKMPMLHFSAHGNDQGMALTSGDFVSWSMLSSSLLSTAKEIALFDPADRMAMFLLSFSTCKGAYARKLLETGTPHPCAAVVGPIENVAWADALTAFMVYFHLMLTKQIGAESAVKIMNLAAGLHGAFHCYSAAHLNQS